MANIEPASGVIQFTGWLKEHNVPLLGKAVDIGAGKGRNSVHLARHGYEVWALEYIELALEAARQLAQNNAVAEHIHFNLTEVDKPWAIADNFFDIETREGREVCRDEMYRTLKPGGYGLITVCSADDEWEKELIANHPGPEPNSTLWPQNGKFQKDYTEQELREFYKVFEIVALKTIQKPAFKLGRDGTATNLWMVVRKSA